MSTENKTCIVSNETDIAEEPEIIAVQAEGAKEGAEHAKEPHQSVEVEAQAEVGRECEGAKEPRQSVEVEAQAEVKEGAEVKEVDEQCGFPSLPTLQMIQSWGLSMLPPKDAVYTGSTGPSGPKTDKTDAVYSLSIDGVPRYFCKTEKDAFAQAEAYLQKIIKHNLRNGGGLPGKKYCIERCGEHALELVCYYILFILPCQSVECRIDIDKLEQIKNKLE